MASLFNMARAAAPRTAAGGLRSAAAASSRVQLAAAPRSLAAAGSTMMGNKNTFVTWFPTSEPRQSEIQQNPGAPPPVENIGVDAV